MAAADGKEPIIKNSSYMADESTMTNILMSALLPCVVSGGSNGAEGILHFAPKNKVHGLTHSSSRMQGRLLRRARDQSKDGGLGSGREWG